MGGSAEDAVGTGEGEQGLRLSVAAQSAASSGCPLELHAPFKGEWATIHRVVSNLWNNVDFCPWSLCIECFL